MSPLNPNRDRMRAAGFDREALETIERAMEASLKPERQAELQREEEQRQRQAQRDELERLKSFADRVEAGSHGQEGKELARRCLEGGRTYPNLRKLQVAIRRLR